jgi:hypothetical protein
MLLFSIVALALTAGGQELPSTSATRSGATVETGTIRGTVFDPSGATLSDAGLTLTNIRTGATYNTQTDSVGCFVFPELQADEFSLNISVAGLDSFTIARIALASGQNLDLAPIKMRLAEVSSKVEVTASKWDIAEAQMKSEQKQRLLGVLPNFYVVYFNDPVPLSAGQKMRLALRQTVDPVSIAIDAAYAGLQTNNKKFAEYGTGAEGFGKRFAAAYLNDATGTIIGSGILPALLHQDPRYHYKGTGTVSSRMLYALSWSFRCRGDNGKWQVNYSSLMGNLATAGISQLYYPKALRDDGAQILQSSLLSFASEGVSALLQEFVFKRLTSHANEAGKGGSTGLPLSSSHPETR